MSRTSLTGICLFALMTVTTACHKNKTTVQPVITSPPQAASQRPRSHRTRTAAIPRAPASQAAHVEPPRLGQMLTPEQERQYNAEIDRSLNGAQGSLRTIVNRRLTVDQQNTMKQIQDLIIQAGEARKTDLVGAKGLADKAQILAQDLLKEI